MARRIEKLEEEQDTIKKQIWEIYTMIDASSTAILKWMKKQQK